MDNNQELRRRVAFLESRLDQLESEFAYVNNLLVECGFPDGVESLKVTIEDLLNDAKIDPKPKKDKPQTFDFF